MNCERVQFLLNGYIDGELDLVNALEIETHLQTCALCHPQYEALLALQRATRDPALFYPAPAHLEKRIRSSLNARAVSRSALPGLSWQWIAPLAILTILIFFIVGILGRGWLAPNQDGLLVQEVQTAHVRSLITSHLTDVTSSDQHTVKPWFSGKLDFSPPVTDLASQGYPLQGGRLDYLNSRSVAALVYQRNKHLINLFIWPSTDSNQAPSTSTYNGYHLVHWSQSGMNYWAVSDLSLSELQSFVQLVQQSITSP